MMHKKSLLLAFALVITGTVFHVSSQTFTPGWTGTSVFPDSVFLNKTLWTTNVSGAAQNDSMQVEASGDTLLLHWTLGTGARDKWAQCYIYLAQPVSLADYDLFSFDIQGTSLTGEVGFELKLEDGSKQASIKWEKLAGLTRWAHNISVAKKQFDNSAPLNWSSIRVISLAVYAPNITANNVLQHGIIKISPLKGTSMASWPRATTRELINPAENTTIKDNALAALVSRQKGTGLLTTWNEDGTSWLYGQGLALKALSLEGVWTSGVPSNPAAVAAEHLALFLANNQEPDGYWPRAWNASTGVVAKLREDNGTVWMGDFPWAITGLQAYFKKSGDNRVKTAINKGLDFLVPLIDANGKFYTKNPATGTTYEVASCEAYAAAILCLEESGDTTHANLLLNYINANGWDNSLRCWREATYSDRIVLFANTWMSCYNFKNSEFQKGLDALTLAGKVLYTEGNGVPGGMDGIVPLAVWYEGTLSYISAGGPGSQALFDSLKLSIHSDGMVPHYSENLGGMGGIWAVDWHSLDGTSWLYFTTAGISPFDVTDGIPATIYPVESMKNDDAFQIICLNNGNIRIIPNNSAQQDILVRFIGMDGKIWQEKSFSIQGQEITISCPTGTSDKIMVVQILYSNRSLSRMLSL